MGVLLCDTDVTASILYRISRKNTIPKGNKETAPFLTAGLRMFLDGNDLPRPVRGPLQVPEGGDPETAGPSGVRFVVAGLGIVHPHLAITAVKVGGPQLQGVLLPDDLREYIPWEAVAAQFAIAGRGLRLGQAQGGKRLLRQVQYRLGGPQVLPGANVGQQGDLPRLMPPGEGENTERRSPAP